MFFPHLLSSHSILKFSWTADYLRVCIQYPFLAVDGVQIACPINLEELGEIKTTCIHEPGNEFSGRAHVGNDLWSFRPHYPSSPSRCGPKPLQPQYPSGPSSFWPHITKYKICTSIYQPCPVRPHYCCTGMSIRPLVTGDRLNFMIDQRLKSVDAFHAILPIIIGSHIFTELSTFYAPEGNSGAFRITTRPAP